MSVQRVPLGVLDLVPIASGSDAARALSNTVELARRAEELGYHRYWFAEHHLNPGVAGTAPAILIALVAGATTRIRLGSGGVQSGHRTALSVVEEFGLLDAAHPGRIDLGLGRSGGRNFLADRLAAAAAAEGKAKKAKQPNEDRSTEGGLLIPARPSLGALAGSPRLGLTADLLQQEGAASADYTELVRDIAALIDGTYRSKEGLDPHPVPGAGAGVDLWVLGSSAGESAAVAGELGLQFAANYHVSPSTVLDAVDAYRASFVPSATLERPYVVVSADVVVADTDESARELAAGYGLWVRSIRRGEGAIPYPGPDEVRAHQWRDEDFALVRDRVVTQFVGAAATVVERLEVLREATGADELMVTTMTHAQSDRIRSFELLAEAWHARRTSTPQRGRVKAPVA
jgi:luciferase family oxidoreductase group 1